MVTFLLISKFFGQPNGTKTPAKQSKLAFSSKSTTAKDPPSSISSKENEDLEMKSAQSETDLKPMTDENEDIDTMGEVKFDKGT